MCKSRKPINEFVEHLQCRHWLILGDHVTRTLCMDMWAGIGAWLKMRRIGVVKFSLANLVKIQEYDCESAREV